jgi:hypothetical protein
MLRFHNVSNCHASDSAFTFVHLGTCDSKPSALLTTVQFVCRQKLCDKACNSSFLLESKVPLYAMKRLTIVTATHHCKLLNVLVSEVPKNRLDARWLQKVNNEIITVSFKKKSYAFQYQMFTASIGARISLA